MEVMISLKVIRKLEPFLGFARLHQQPQEFFSYFKYNNLHDPIFFKRCEILIIAGNIRHNFLDGAVIDGSYGD